MAALPSCHSSASFVSARNHWVPRGKQRGSRSACLAVADGVVRLGEAGQGDGPLAFVPDSLLADEPADVEPVKRGLREAYRRLCDLEWDTLLLAHGLPLVGDGKQELRAFAGG